MQNQQQNLPNNPDVLPDWFDSPVRRGMNPVASQYFARRWEGSRVRRWDYEMTRRALLETLDPQRDEDILEIGCGPGTWTAEVAPHCRSMVAVDITENMLREAEQRTLGMPVTYVHSDFMEATFDRQFDKVVSARVIEYIADRAGMAERVSAALAPGGLAVLVTKTRFSIWRGRMRLVYWRAGPLKKLAGAMGHHTAPDSKVRQYLPSPDQLIAAFAPHGLTPERVRPVIVRAPLFQKGFHEVPLIPDGLAAPMLAVCTLGNGIVASLPGWLRWAPMMISESYCIAFRKRP